MLRSKYLEVSRINRFVAEWVTKQHVDSEGEWNPDLDEFVYTHWHSKEAAEAAAIKGSKLSGIEWIHVIEQEYRNRQWRDIHSWSGDWSGLDGKGYAL